MAPERKGVATVSLEDQLIDALWFLREV